MCVGTFYCTPQADKLDPREQAKHETREWINDVVDRLTVRIEQFEYEMEEMQANLKKKAKPPPKLVQVRRALFAQQPQPLYHCG